jgi:hypothetical protein
VTKRILLLTVALFGGPTALLAREPLPATKLSLTPQGPPAPALRFALLPELRDQVPGNAAPLYRKAGDRMENIPPVPNQRTAQWELIAQWIAMPYAQLPRDQVRKVLEQYKEPLDLLEQASRAETCDWELAQRLREQGVRALVPELQKMRNASEILRLKGRLELADDRPDLALRTLRYHFLLARRLGDTPLLIGHLVGIAVTAQACNALESVITHPRTPNLSWSLIGLPHPFLDVRKAFEGERIGAYGTFPGALEVATNPEAGPLPQEQAEKIMKSFLTIDFGIDGQPLMKLAERFMIGQQIRAKHEIAKQALIAAGRPRDKVEQWPHVQVALMHALMEYDQMLDEMMKVQDLPFWQAAPKLDEIDRRTRASRNRGPKDPAIPLAPLFVPATGKITIARHRMDRQLAALRCLEAIRLYAADHEGRLPQTLADIKTVPIPVCPFTGQPFEYRPTGDHTAELAAPRVDDRRGVIQPLRYELTLRSQ